METPTKQRKPKTKGSKSQKKNLLSNVDEGFMEIPVEQVRISDVISSLFMITLLICGLILVLKYLGVVDIKIANWVIPTSE